MKIYTKTGDCKMSDLVGSRVPKDDPIIEMCGINDEALAYLGLIYQDVTQEVQENLLAVMKIMFKMNADLANKANEEYFISGQEVHIIEGYIDLLSKDLDLGKSFVMPVFSYEASIVNVVRTLVRKVERLMVSQKNLNDKLYPLVNRLSDYFYVLSLNINTCDEVPMDFDKPTKKVKPNKKADKKEN